LYGHDRQAEKRHPYYRIAIVVPWLGSQLPPWIEYFVESCKSNQYLFDWIILHEGLEARPVNHADNVIYHDIGTHGIARLHGEHISAALNLDEEMTLNLTQTFVESLGAFPKLLVDLKPTTGTVFAEYLKDYSHWSWGDIDMIVGDMVGWVNLAELEDFDIFTYTFGDNERLYTRGQFAAHRNIPRINALWQACPELSTNIYLEARRHTGVTERCYPYALAQAVNVRVLFTPKAMADFGDPSRVVLFDRKVGRCLGATTAELAHCHRRLRGKEPRTELELLERNRGLQGELITVEDPFELAFTLEPCADWWLAWRVCVTFPVGLSASAHSVVLHNGVPVAFPVLPRYHHAETVEQAAFFHFQTWKVLPGWARGSLHPHPWLDAVTPASTILHPQPFMISSMGIFPLADVVSNES
jgi:hypothetical protein